MTLRILCVLIGNVSLCDFTGAYLFVVTLVAWQLRSRRYSVIVWVHVVLLAAIRKNTWILRLVHHLPLVYSISVHFIIVSVVLLNNLVAVHGSAGAILRVASSSVHRSASHLPVICHLCLMTMPLVFLPLFVSLHFRLVVVGLLGLLWIFMPASYFGRGIIIVEAVKVLFIQRIGCSLLLATVSAMRFLFWLFDFGKYVVLGPWDCFDYLLLVVLRHEVFSVVVKNVGVVPAFPFDLALLDVTELLLRLDVAGVEVAIIVVWFL